MHGGIAKDMHCWSYVWLLFRSDGIQALVLIGLHTLVGTFQSKGCNLCFARGCIVVSLDYLTFQGESGQ